MNELDARLLTAHDAADSIALVSLYTEAADHALTPDAAGFYLTQAHVFALEAGLPQAWVVRDKLIAMGRETPLHGT